MSNAQGAKLEQRFNSFYLETEKQSKTQVGLTKPDIHYGDYSYKGETQINKRHGIGKLTDLKGNSYEGNFKNDKIEGFGTLQTQNGKYVGEWKDSHQEGEGQEIWQDQQRYVGQFKGGLKNGKGRYFFANDCVYEGEWFADEIQGQVGL